jgi:hypothetical protein
MALFDGGSPFGAFGTGPFGSHPIPAPLTNPYGTNPNYVPNTDALMGMVQNNGLPFGNAVSSGFNELLGQVDSPAVAPSDDFDAWVRAKGIAPRGMITNYDRENTKVSMKCIMMGTSPRSGRIVHRFKTINTERHENIFFKFKGKEVQTSNIIEVCGSTQQANLHIAWDQLKYMDTNGTLERAMNKAFNADYVQPISALVEKSQPIGWADIEAAYVGSDSYRAKIDGGSSHFLTNKSPTVICDLLQKATHKKVPSIVPPLSQHSHHIYIVLVPTKIKNGTKYVTGGRPMWNEYPLSSPYQAGMEPDIWETDTPECTFTFSDDPNAFVWIYQYQVFVTAHKKFPSDLIVVDQNAKEERERFRETRIYRTTYPHWWWQAGNISKCPEFPHTGKPSKHFDMQRASQDMLYETLTLGDGKQDIANLYVDIDCGMSDYGC